MNLRQRAIRLAYAKPLLRDHLLPLLKQAVVYTQEPKYQRILNRYMHLDHTVGVVLEKLDKVILQLEDAIKWYDKNLKSAYDKLEGLSEEEQDDVMESFLTTASGLSEEEQDFVIGEFVDHIYEHTKPMAKLREIGESYADLVGDFYPAISKLRGWGF
jgi:hypothetical protein